MTPQLRFPEFTDEWQEKKLSEIASFVNGYTFLSSTYDKSGKYSIITIANVQEGRMDTTKANRVKDIPFNIQKDQILQLNDILISMTGNVGRVCRVDTENCLLNQRVGKIVTNAASADFVFAVLNSKKFLVEMESLAQGGAQGNLSSKDIMKYKFLLPTYNEQQKIADFLTAVDERIAVSGKKLELLETYKRGVMQQIFSQKIRFKDENGNEYPEWEEKKLSEIFDERNKQVPESKKYPLMAFVAYLGVAPKGDRYNRQFLVNKGEAKKYKQTEYGDFIYSSNNLETGSIGLNKYGSASISPVYSIFSVKNGNNSQFIGSYLLRKRFIYEMVRFRQGVVYGQWRIHESEFLKIAQQFPSLEEQQKVATFLTALDDKITAEKSKLTATKQFKKALLQRMFV